MIAFVIGIGIPLGIIFLLNLLRFRIEGHTDVEKLTKVPIIGDIPLTGSSKHEESAIAVRENDNDIMTETFRSLRTNLLFMMGDPDKKVVLITSTISGEGKTFIASNLALSLALLGKKVILVGLDIRKPGLNKLFHLSHKEKGITQYLAAPQIHRPSCADTAFRHNFQPRPAIGRSHPTQSYGTTGTPVTGRHHQYITQRI